MEKQKQRKKQMAKIEYYKDKANEWRWRIIAENGNVISSSSEGYVNQSDCVRSAEITKQTLNEVEQGDSKEFLAE